MAVKRVAIVAAMEREVAPLLRHALRDGVGTVRFYELEFAVVAIGGIGREAAKRAAEMVVVRVRPEILISAGVAGALRRELKVGDVVAAREVVDAETGVRFAGGGSDGLVVTGGTVTSIEGKRRLLEQFGAEVVDMEAAEVADVARRHGLEFAVLKAVSDEFDFAMPPLAQFVNEAGQFSAARFVAYVALRPQWWGTVRALSKNTHIASVNLSGALEHLIRQHTKAIREENVSRR